MAIRNSNNYKVGIMIEGTYGTQEFIIDSSGLVLPDKLDWNYAPITAELIKKGNSAYKAQNHYKITGSMATATLTGELTSGHELLLALHLDDSDGTPYLYASDLPTTLSANIYQLYLNSAGTITSYDVLLGAVITSFQITGEANGIIQYTATIEADGYRQEVSNTGGDTVALDSPGGVGEYFLFGKMLATLWDGSWTLNSFSLNIQKSYVDNALRFQNSMTKTNDRYIQVGGTLQITQLWDGSTHGTDKSLIYNQSPQTNTLSLIGDMRVWDIGLEGVISDAQRPDADRGIFLGNYTFDLTSGGSTYGVPIQIDIT
jgi:hypothetical protein